MDIVQQQNEWDLQTIRWNFVSAEMVKNRFEKSPQQCRERFPN
jgi:hypothetical protein